MVWIHLWYFFGSMSIFFGSHKWEPHSRRSTCIYIWEKLDIYACCSSTMWFPFMATENALVDVINHRISSRSPCRPIMNSFHNLPFVSFRWWSFIDFRCGRKINKVTITAIENGLDLFYYQTMLATPYII